MLKHQLLPSIPHIFLVRRNLRAVHRPVAHGKHPRRLLAINTSQILGEPLVLLVGLVVLPAAIDIAEGTRIGGESLVLLGQGLVAAEVTDERPLRAVGEVGLAVQGDEVGEAEVEGVPEVCAAGVVFFAIHGEAVLVSGEVSVDVSMSVLCSP